MIPQWIVEHGRGMARRRAVFESDSPAWRHAVSEAYSDTGAIVYVPDVPGLTATIGGESGARYLVLRLQPGTEVVVQKRIDGGV